jgi:hypothetical protein
VVSTLHRSMNMTAMRELGILALTIGTVVVVFAPRRRALVVQRLTQAHRFVSARIADRDARESRDRWDDDGGARKY